MTRSSRTHTAGAGVMSRAKRVKDAGNAGAPGNLHGAGGARRTEFLSSLGLKMGCPQHGRRETQRRGWAGTGGSPKGKEADLSAAAGKLQIRTLHENRAGAGRAGLGSKDTTLTG